MTPQITGDEALVRPLHTLTQRLAAAGAWFNEDLEIRAGVGDLAMCSQRRYADRRSVLRVPLAAMPFKEDFRWTLEGDRLRAEPVGPDTEPLHREMMDLMLEVYNQAGKMAQWRQVCPWTALEDHPDLLNRLLVAKAAAPKVQRFQEWRAAGRRQALMVESFLGARIFRLTAEHLQAVGRQEGPAVLMPIIDYFNHQLQAEGFQIQPAPAPISMRVFSRPDPQTGELFVRYNLYDPLDTYLFYGFVDTECPWLASVPLTLDTAGGRLEVLNSGGAFKGALPPAMRDLRAFMPAVVRQEAGHLQLTKLILPGERAPRALQRVLAGLLTTLGVPRDRVHREVARLEAEVLERNEAYWEDLAWQARALEQGHPLQTLCRQAREHLAAYRRMRPVL
ncbi:hypothetical protein [Ectothiorhodospira mobilis]|uniref:hypothetical protein n=1 Tax=Ectothiorhodospira mobilis TaxID=195064 RepID=UPI0019050088|nr:hypothetical protein [Ectothiorhodospira mobilis]MBK1693025.1 hypothetical protein [Ectothiorhodospira mobilis]